MLGATDFLSGLAVGLVITLVIIRLVKRKRTLRVDQKVAPSLLEIELKRAKRLDYGLALILFRPKAKITTDLKQWFDNLGTSLRLREYDIVLQWSNYDILVVLPGAKDEKNLDPLRKRFDYLLKEGGWSNIPYGIALYPTHGDDIPRLIGHARNHTKRSSSAN